MCGRPGEVEALTLRAARDVVERVATLGRRLDRSDQPVMTEQGATWVIDAMEQLGIDEDEARGYAEAVTSLHLFARK